MNLEKTNKTTDLLYIFMIVQVHIKGNLYLPNDVTYRR